MKWSMDTHKYISEISRKALQILYSNGITSESSQEEIENAERELANNEVYRNFESARGRIRRALFTYFKSYNCMDENEGITEIGLAFAEDKLSVKEFSFSYILNYKYQDENGSYFPTQMLLYCLKLMRDINLNEAYITPYDFMRITELNEFEDITNAFIDDLIAKHSEQTEEVSERAIGFDVWAKMLVQSGVLKRNADRNLEVLNWSLAEWILDTYSHGFDIEVGKISTGIISGIPTIPQLNTNDIVECADEYKSIQAFIFEGLSDRVIDQYVISTEKNISDIKTILGLNENSRGFYKNFIGLERIVAYSLLDSVEESQKNLGKILLEIPIENTERLNIENDFSRNRILFGAPGTGKSFTLNKEKNILLANGGEYERVTFHPDYSYANFVGTYKPVPSVDELGNDIITYSYVPGPFMRTYVNALRSYQTGEYTPHLLLIEEINRANVAAVFGDVFQLLDRDENGFSEYPIQTSEDIKKYLSIELGGMPNDYSEIRIPNNMFIWATMNSADQGVFPMDTAFKRRWDFTYLGVDDAENNIRGKAVNLGTEDSGRVVEWNELRKAINDELLKYKVNEDKLLGPFFISKKDLPNGEIIEPESFIEVFKNKVIMYLFDDAAKQKRQTLFSGCSESARNQYSKICREFDTKGVFIFCESISDKFMDRIQEEDEE